MFDFLKRMFGRPRKGEPTPIAVPATMEPGAAAAPPASGSAFQEIDAKYEAALKATCEGRDRFWSSVGEVEPDFISYLISPGLMGGPHWPTTRQAFRVIRRTTSVIVASDGLADPFDGTDPYGNGFETELFIETASLPAETMTEPGVEAFKTSWPFVLVENVARVVADAGGIRHDLDELGVISAELPGMALHPVIAEQIPQRFIAENETLGVLIGVPATTVPALMLDMPNATVRVPPIVLMTAAELGHVRAGGANARRQLLAHLAAHDSHICSLERPSAV